MLVRATLAIFPEFWTSWWLNDLCLDIYQFNWRVGNNLDGLIVEGVGAILGTNRDLRHTHSCYVRGSIRVGGTLFLQRFRVFALYYIYSQPTNMIWFLRLGLGLVAAFADGRSDSIWCLGVATSSSTLSWFSTWTWQSSCWLYPGDGDFWLVLGVIIPRPRAVVASAHPWSNFFFWDRWDAMSSSLLGEESTKPSWWAIFF